MVKLRRYKVRVVEQDGRTEFHRPSCRMVMCELRLLWDEYPNAKRIEIEVRS